MMIANKTQIVIRCYADDMRVDWPGHLATWSGINPVYLSPPFRADTFLYIIKHSG